MRRIRFLAFVVALTIAPLTALAVELNVYAAASLSDALKEIAPRYAKATGDALRFNFGASGTLARQIKEGAPADVFLSADELRLDQLEQAGLLLPGTRRALLANALVVVVPIPDPAPVATLADLARADVHRIAIGEPATVPVGTYTKEYLQKNRLWKPLFEKMVPLDNVRAVLAAVEAGNAEAGFVYQTDALLSKKVRVVIEIPPQEGLKITYPVAVLRRTRSEKEARALVDYLDAAEARAVFARYGFLRVP